MAHAPRAATLAAAVVLALPLPAAALCQPPGAANWNRGDTVVVGFSGVGSSVRKAAAAAAAQLSRKTSLHVSTTAGTGNVTVRSCDAPGGDAFTYKGYSTWSFERADTCIRSDIASLTFGPTDKFSFQDKNPNPFSPWTLVEHEIGHDVGLGHDTCAETGQYTSIMDGKIYTDTLADGTPPGRYLPGDVATLRQLYGARGTAATSRRATVSRAVRHAGDQ